MHIIFIRARISRRPRPGPGRYLAVHVKAWRDPATEDLTGPWEN